MNFTSAPEVESKTRKEYLRQWHLRNKERRLKARQARYQNDPQKENARSKAWAAKNKDKCRGYNKAYRAKHRSKIQQNWSNYYARNKARILSQKKGYNQSFYAANREIIRVKHSVYYRKNAERLRAQARTHRLKNLEKRQRQCRAWHATKGKLPEFVVRKKQSNSKLYYRNKPNILARHRNWRKLNRDKCRLYKMKRRALEKKALVNLAGINAFVSSVLSKAKAQCSYCNEWIPSSEVHFDHIVPLSKGGEHSAANLCVSCQTCNLRKGRTLPEIWMRIPKGIVKL